MSQTARPVAVFKGPTSWGREGKERREGKGEERVGKMREEGRGP